MAANLLEARQIRKEFGGLVAVSDIDLHDPGGCDRQPDRAERRREDHVLQHDHRRLQADCRTDHRSTAQDITAKPPHAVTERGIGRTFQNIRLFQDMTALENVLVGMHSRLRGGIIGSILGTPKVKHEEAAAEVKARELLAYCSLVDRDRRLRAQSALR